MSTITHLNRYPKRITFVTWVCKCGNETKAPDNAIEVWCPLAGHSGTNRMAPKDPS